MSLITQPPVCGGWRALGAHPHPFLPFYSQSISFDIFRHVSPPVDSVQPIRSFNGSAEVCEKIDYGRGSGVLRTMPLHTQSCCLNASRAATRLLWLLYRLLGRCTGLGGCCTGLGGVVEASGCCRGLCSVVEASGCCSGPWVCWRGLGGVVEASVVL